MNSIYRQVEHSGGGLGFTMRAVSAAAAVAVPAQTITSKPPTFPVMRRQRLRHGS